MDTLTFPTVALLAAFVLVTGFVLLYILLVLLSPTQHPTHPDERTYLSAASPKTPLKLPSLASAPTVQLSIIVPAFNEELRMGVMLDATFAHLDSLKPPRSYEILIVDDCSSDATSQLALRLAQSHASVSPKNEIRVVRLLKNRGKGGAVKHGCLHARGERLLFVDADGASRFEDLEALWTAMDKIEGEEKLAIAIGSRAHLVKTEAVVKRSFIRNFLMYGLHFTLRTLGVGHIRDTQCGFKLFTRPAAQLLFPPQHISTWMFDVELFILAQQLNIPVAEVPIAWHEVPGSKMSLMRDSLLMLKDLVVLRANYLLGRWSADEGRLKKE